MQLPETLDRDTGSLFKTRLPSYGAKSEPLFYQGTVRYGRWRHRTNQGLEGTGGSAPTTRDEHKHQTSGDVYRVVLNLFILNPQGLFHPHIRGAAFSPFDLPRDGN
jgi:hypothetical protein